MEIYIKEIDRSLRRKCISTHWNEVPEFVHSELHFVTSSFAATFETVGLMPLNRMYRGPSCSIGDTDQVLL